jgi:Flp pilus assembly protein TadB
MIAALVAGGGLGLGLLLMFRGLFPPPPSLASTMERLRGSEDPGSQRSRVGPVLRGLARGLGADLDSPGKRQDLRVTGTSGDELLIHKFVLLVVPLAAASGLGTVRLLGLAPVPLLVIWMLVLGGIAGWLLPDEKLASEAKARRRSFRQALSYFLDLVSVSLAGGAQPMAAMGQVAVLGERSWAFEEIARPLALASRLGRPPWEDLARLGEELGIPELYELTSSLVLAGSEGATVHRTLAAKAESLRARRITEAEAEEAATGERMSLPLVLLGVGFLIFIGFPAVTRVLTGLG